MPEYQNMKRLDQSVILLVDFIGTYLTVLSFQDRLSEWSLSRLRSDCNALDLLRGLFIYDPERRLTAKQALLHRWFQEEPRPTWKYVL